MCKARTCIWLFVVLTMKLEIDMDLSLICPYIRLIQVFNKYK